MARVGTSMGITTAMFGMALSGNFTGPPPRDRNLRLTMENQSGVLAKITQIFASNSISIDAMVQKEIHDNDAIADIIVITSGVVENKMNKIIIIISLLSLTFTQELKVEGNLNVTGHIQNQTIDSLLQVIQDLQNQINLMNGGIRLVKVKWMRCILRKFQ